MLIENSDKWEILNDLSPPYTATEEKNRAHAPELLRFAYIF
jgi:hypothetical protein